MCVSRVQLFTGKTPKTLQSGLLCSLLRFFPPWKCAEHNQHREKAPGEKSEGNQVWASKSSFSLESQGMHLFPQQTAVMDVKCCLSGSSLKTCYPQFLLGGSSHRHVPGMSPDSRLLGGKQVFSIVHCSMSSSNFASWPAYRFLRRQVR